MNRQDIINIHIGQAGCQIGNACWELFCLEHGIGKDGCLLNCASEWSKFHNDTTFHSFFYESQSRKFVPRAVYIDLDPTVIDEVRSGCYKHLFHPDSLVSGKEDAASNYGRAYNTSGKQIINQVIEKVRLQVEESDNFQGFFIFHSFAGGTGSGFTSLLMEKLSEIYDKKRKLQFPVYPSPHISSIVVEPYNSVLHMSTCLEESDCCFIMDNEAAFDICFNKLEIEKPRYIHVNRLFAQALSTLTSNFRFDGQLRVTLNEFLTNIVPSQRFHFPLISYAPVCSLEKALHSQTTTTQITKMCFDSSNQLSKTNTRLGKHMSVSLLYRGDVKQNEIINSVRSIKKDHKIRFVNQSSAGFNVGCTYQSPAYIKNTNIAGVLRTVTMIANTTAIAESWARLIKKFDIMYKKKAFIHWYYAENMTENDFLESRDNVLKLENDYLNS